MENVNILDIDGTQWEIQDKQARQNIADLKTSSDKKIEEINAKLEQKADKNAELLALTIKNDYSMAQIIPWSDGTHYRSYEYENNENYTDIITENGNAKIVRFEKEVMKSIREIATMDKITDLIKPLTVKVYNSEFKNSMDMSSRVTIPNGYKFLCWVNTSTSAWVPSSPISMNNPFIINGYPYSIEEGRMPTGNNESINFMYFVIRQ